MGKYLWDISQKKDSLWLRWIDHMYMKGAHWRLMKPKQNSCWYWKQICRVKEKLEQGFNGDSWCDGAGYTVAKGYKWLRSNIQNVKWDCWVGNRFNIPKHAFIAWLVMWKRIQTKDWLANHGYVTDYLCPLCFNDPESVSHLFFSCPYSLNCCKELGKIIKNNQFFLSLDECDKWLQKSRSCYKKKVIQALIVALIYNIWMQRNMAIWEGKIVDPKVVVRTLKLQVISRITNLSRKKPAVADWNWISQL